MKNNPLESFLSRVKGSKDTTYEHIDAATCKAVTSPSTTTSTPARSEDQPRKQSAPDPSASVLYNVRLRTTLTQGQIASLWSQIHDIIHKDAPQDWPHVYAIDEGLPRGWVASSLASMKVELPSQGHEGIAMRVRRECEGVVEISRACYL